MEEWGQVNLKLDEFLKKNHISRSSLSRKCSNSLWSIIEILQK